MYACTDKFIPHLMSVLSKTVIFVDVLLLIYKDPLKIQVVRITKESEYFCDSRKYAQ